MFWLYTNQESGIQHGRDQPKTCSPKQSGASFGLALPSGPNSKELEGTFNLQACWSCVGTDWRCSCNSALRAGNLQK